MRVIAIDMDGTALAHPDKVRELMDDYRNFIVIHTARQESIRAETVRELFDANIPYHSLVMNKVRADVYIDDRNEGGLQWPK